MKKFHFSLDPLLAIKEGELKLLKEKLKEVTLIASSLEKESVVVKKKIDETQETLHIKKEQGDFSHASLDDHYFHLLKNELRRNEKKKEQNEALLKEKNTQMIALMQGIKRLKKLKERRRVRSQKDHERA